MTSNPDPNGRSRSGMPAAAELWPSLSPSLGWCCVARCHRPTGHVSAGLYLITARMVHVYVGPLLGGSGDLELAARALAGLTGRCATPAVAATLTSVAPLEESPDEKQALHMPSWCWPRPRPPWPDCRGSRAAQRSVRGLGPALLRVRGRDVRRLEPQLHPAQHYRGVNANMHGVEALLAAADVTGDDMRASVPSESLAAWRWSSPNRTPGGYPNTSIPPGSRSWITTGIARTITFRPLAPRSGTAWNGRDCCCIWRHRLPTRRLGCCAAEALFERAVTDGWAVDGADGFVYTTD